MLFKCAMFITLPGEKVAISETLEAEFEMSTCKHTRGAELFLNSHFFSTALHTLIHTNIKIFHSAAQQQVNSRSTPGFVPVHDSFLRLTALYVSNSHLFTLSVCCVFHSSICQMMPDNKQWRLLLIHVINYFSYYQPFHSGPDAQIQK